MERERFLVSYALTFQKEPAERAIDLLLAEITCGIQYVSTREGVWMEKICDAVPFVDESTRGELVSTERRAEDAYLVTYGFPASNLDPSCGGLSNLWPMVAGEVFNFHFIKKAVLAGLDLPRSFEDHYLGPRFGVEGIRDAVGVRGGPMFGSIIKPNIGLDPERSARTAAILAGAGFDFIKDDEVCVSPRLCPLGERVRRIAETVDRASQRLGRRILYAANVTTDSFSMGKAAETALRAGADALMIDPFCTGLSGVDFLRRSFEAPIYAHRVGYGLHCLGETYSVSYEVFTKLFRLLGTDFSHVGGIWGGAATAREKTARYLDILRKGGSKKPAWPVVTGISLENMSDYHGFYGDDTMFMDHIGIYRDEDTSREKLLSLRKRIGKTRERGEPA